MRGKVYEDVCPWPLDDRKKQLFLARDRAGKNLSLTAGRPRSGLLFGQRAQVGFTGPGGPPGMNPVASMITSLTSTPASHSILTGFKKFPGTLGCCIATGKLQSVKVFGPAFEEAVPAGRRRSDGEPKARESCARR